MANGFLGYNATFMLDLVVCALVLVVPVLVWSIYRVKIRRDYVTHKRVQLALAGVLLLTVAAFEIDVQLVHAGWRNIVLKAHPDVAPERLDFVRNLLLIHLVFAISTPLLWAVTIGLALRRFGDPPRPSSHSQTHSTLGWLSAADLTLTSVTGLLFYYVAFIAG